MKSNIGLMQTCQAAMLSYPPPGTALTELRLTVWGDDDVTVTAYISYQLPSGLIEHATLVCACNGIAAPGNTAVIADFPSALILSISIISNTQKGACYAGMYLFSNNKTIVLFNGYPSNIAVTYPIPTKDHYDLPLWHRTITAPAAGANFTIDIAGRELWENWFLKFRLVTSATVANRHVALEFNDPIDGLLFRAVAPAVQAASLTYDYVFGCFGASALQNTTQMVAMPDFPLSAAYSAFTGNIPDRSLDSVVTNLQAGDQISLIRLSGKRHIGTN